MMKIVIILTLAILLQAIEGSIMQECMQTTREFGDARRSEDIEFVSNMKDVVNIGDHIMFMRTINLYFCSSAQRIHSVRVSLRHDPVKDPAETESLSLPDIYDSSN